VLQAPLALRNLGGGDEEIVADDLHFVAGGLVKALHSRGIVLGKGVFDGNDRVVLDPAQQHGVELLGCQRAVLERELIASGAVELRGGDIERDGGIDARLEARVGNGAAPLRETFLVRLECGPVAAFVGHAVQRALLCESRAGRRRRSARSTRAPRAKLPAPMQITMYPADPRATRVRAAAVDLDLRHGERDAPLAGQLSPQWKLLAAASA